MDLKGYTIRFVQKSMFYNLVIVCSSTPSKIESAVSFSVGKKWHFHVYSHMTIPTCFLAQALRSPLYV